MENITPATRSDIAPRQMQWSPIVLGAFAATALTSVLLTFAVTIGLGVASTAPTWRDASAALAILSGLYLIIQAVLSFGLGGYIAGHSRVPTASATVEDTEHLDGAHGLAVAQDLITRHGGLIEFESEPGRTIFTLLLPLEDAT